MKLKTVKRQIPETLLLQLCQYVFIDEPSAELRQQCMDGLQVEINRIATNELYHQSKVARNPEDRRQALIKWYQAKHIPEDFWVL